MFTDKTGTLTENEMQFRECSINGTKYREVNGKLLPEGMTDDSPDGSMPPLVLHIYIAGLVLFFFCFFLITCCVCIHQEKRGRENKNLCLIFPSRWVTNCYFSRQCHFVTQFRSATTSQTAWLWEETHSPMPTGSLPVPWSTTPLHQMRKL